MVNTLATFTAASSREDVAAELTAVATLDLSHGGSILMLPSQRKVYRYAEGEKESRVYLEGRIDVAKQSMMMLMMME